MAEQTPGLLGRVGNFLLQSHAYGDPRVTFRRNTPHSLLDDFEEEEQVALGKSLQEQFRTLGRSRSGIREAYAEDIQSEIERRNAAAELKQFQNFVVNSPDYSDAEKRRLLLLGPEKAGELLSQSGATLDPGDLRVDPLGRGQIRNATQEQQDYAAAKADGYQGTFQQWQDRNVRTEVSPGETVLGPDDKPVYTNPTERQQDKAAGLADDSQPGVRERKIADWKRLNPNLTDREVVGIVDGHIDVRQDPQSGRNFIVDINGTQKPVQTVGVDDNLDMTGKAAVPEGVDVEETTGVAGAWRRSVNTVADMIGLGTPYAATDEARSALANFGTGFVLRVASTFSPNDRRSNLVIEEIKKDLPSPESILQGSENAKRKLEALDRTVLQLADQHRFVVENPYSFSHGQVQEARQALKILNNTSADLQRLIGNFGGGGKVKPRGDGSDAPPGVPPEDWRYMTDEERALWQN